MTMKTHSILFKRFGENLTSAPDPVAVWTGQVDLETEAAYCVSSDNDMLVMGKVYAVHEVTLPEWLSPEEWIGSSTMWKYTWGMGVDPTWPENVQRALAKMGESERYAAAKLLKVKKFRSEFRASLAAQLTAWINGDRKYASPFSARQWECLLDTYTSREAESRSRGLYWSRGLNLGAADHAAKSAA